MRIAPEVRVRTPFTWAEHANRVEQFAVDPTLVQQALSPPPMEAVLIFSQTGDLYRVDLHA